MNIFTKGTWINSNILKVMQVHLLSKQIYPQIDNPSLAFDDSFDNWKRKFKKNV